MKQLKTPFLFILFLAILSLTIIGQETLDDTPEFLFALIEVESKADGTIDINVLSSKVIAQSLKTPTRSKGTGQKSKDLLIAIKDDNDNSLDEISVSDVFTSHLEYVDEDGNLRHHDDLRKKKVIQIRRRITKNATALSIKQGGSLKSTSTYNYNFRK